MKAETEAEERTRPWAEVKEKAEIARVAAEAREKAEYEATEMERPGLRQREGVVSQACFPGE